MILFMNLKKMGETKMYMMITHFNLKIKISNKIIIIAKIMAQKFSMKIKME
jgi:hypothetical protein